MDPALGVLIPTARLRPLEPELCRRAQERGYSISLDAGALASAFLRSMMFQDWPELLGEALPPDQRFYNAYFWYLRFATLYQAQHGPDPGIEQWSMQLLSSAGDVDWKVVEALGVHARAGYLEP